MHRGAWWATVHGVRQLDMIERLTPTKEGRMAILRWKKDLVFTHCHGTHRNLLTPAFPPKETVLLLLSHPAVFRLLATPWTAALQASLSFTTSRSLPKFMFIASVMPSSHLILWLPLLHPPSIFPSIRDFISDAVSNDADAAMSHAMQGHPRWMGNSREFWQNVIGWRKEWQTTPVYLPWEPHELHKRKQYLLSNAYVQTNNIFLCVYHSHPLPSKKVD